MFLRRLLVPVDAVVDNEAVRLLVTCGVCGLLPLVPLSHVRAAIVFCAMIAVLCPLVKHLLSVQRATSRRRRWFRSEWSSLLTASSYVVPVVRSTFRSSCLTCCLYVA